MRSVKTSVSGLETSSAPKPATRKLEITKENSKSNGLESDRSSISELNDLLNDKKQEDAKDTSRPDALEELNVKFEVCNALIIPILSM